MHLLFASTACLFVFCMPPLLLAMKTEKELWVMYAELKFVAKAVQLTFLPHLQKSFFGEATSHANKKGSYSSSKPNPNIIWHADADGTIGTARHFFAKDPPEDVGPFFGSVNTFFRLHTTELKEDEPHSVISVTFDKWAEGFEAIEIEKNEIVWLEEVESHLVESLEPMTLFINEDEKVGRMLVYTCFYRALKNLLDKCKIKDNKMVQGMSRAYDAKFMEQKRKEQPTENNSLFNRILPRWNDLPTEQTRKVWKFDESLIQVPGWLAKMLGAVRGKLLKMVNESEIDAVNSALEKCSNFDLSPFSPLEE